MTDNVQKTDNTIELLEQQSPSIPTQAPLSKENLNKIADMLTELKDIKTQLDKYQPTLFAWLPKKIDFITCCFFYGITKRQRKTQLIEIIDAVLPKTDDHQTETEAIKLLHQNFQPVVNNKAHYLSDNRIIKTYQAYLELVLQDVSNTIREIIRYEIQATAQEQVFRLRPSEKSRFFNLFNNQRRNNLDTEQPILPDLPHVSRSIRLLKKDYEASLRHYRYSSRR